jgi:hypothetical protein
MIRCLAGRDAGEGKRAQELVVTQARWVPWYNPKLEDFEWREVPASDDEALAVLAGSPHTPVCTETYREWRALGASIAAALIRAGEAARRTDQG